MNAHTPFDANQDWSNPYCQNRSNDPMVDALLGNAYHVVRTVYCNLGYIKHLYDFLSKYGVVICVQSEAELKTLTTEAKYARIYDKSPAGDLRVTDYLYVEDDRTGVLPDDTTATGSWVKVATSNSGVDSKDGGYIPWVYNSGSANGGETSIRIPDETAGAPFMIVNGDWQTEGYDFEYDPLTFEIKFTTPLEQGDFVVVMRTGVPATPDNPNVSDWVTINWLYNHGAAVGGEQVIDIPYTFQSVPAVYKNGLRFSKGLANNSYTIDSDNNRIILTEPLATNDRLVIQLGGEAKILETVDHTIQEVARSANVKDSEVILSTDTTQVLNGKRVIYDVVTQRIYGLPILPTNVYINSVSNGQLTYSPGNITVTLLDSYQQQNARELWRRSLAEAGLTLVDGSFEEGATANNKTDAVWYIAGGQCYTWDSTFPKSVPADSIPESSGGINVGAWVSVGDALLRQELVSSGGGNIPGWYDAPSSVRASNHKTPSNSWQDAINSARIASGANSPIVIGASATGAETVPVQYGLPSGVTGYHLSQGTSEAPSTDKRPLILFEKVCDSLDSSAPHTMANFSMKYVGGVKGAVPLSSYIEASGAAEGGAIAIQGRAKTTVATSSGWGGWSYIDVQSVLPVRAIGHEINVRCNIPSPLEWSASGGAVDALVIATVDNGSNNMANSAIKVSRSSQGLGFLSGLRFGYRSIVPSDTSDMTKLNGEAILINGGSSNAERYGGIRIGANDGFGFTRFHYGLRTNEAEFNNNVAIWLGDNHRIRWGTQLSSGPYLHYNAADFEFVGAALNVVNGLGSSLKLNSVKVLGPRVTGIHAMTGTADGTSKDTETVTLPELARIVKKLLDAALTHGFVGPT